MLLFLQLLFLYPIHSLQHEGFEPLNILILQDLELPAKVQKALHGGIMNLQKSVQVNSLQNVVISGTDVLQCLQEDSITILSQPVSTSVITSSGVINRSRIQIRKGCSLKKSNFAIVVTTNNRCEKDADLMASAHPCYIRGNQRPVLARVLVCPELERWKVFIEGGTAVDVVRHELLHALGWGTVTTDDAVVPPVQYKWKLPSGSSQPANRFFMSYANSSTDYAKKHFDCPNLQGIEAEENEGKHLSEYIFGNELMTPTISSSANYFTEISARILEGTFTGKRPWYRVTRSAIAKENNEYKHGKGWGCTFILSSCHEYIQERIKDGRSTFPFCTENDYQTIDQELTVCSSTGRTELYMCDIVPFDKRTAASNGVTPVPLSKIFPSLGADFSDQMASSMETRFCPFIQAVSLEEYFDSPPIDEMKPCKN